MILSLTLGSVHAEVLRWTIGLPSLVSQLLPLSFQSEDKQTDKAKCYIQPAWDNNYYLLRCRDDEAKCEVWKSIFSSKFQVCKQLSRGAALPGCTVIVALRQITDDDNGQTGYNAAWARCIRSANRSSMMMNGPVIMDGGRQQANTRECKVANTCQE